MACVVVAALGCFRLLSPKQTERDLLRQQSEQVRGELAQAQALEASLGGFGAQAEALRKRLEAAQERLPTEKEMPGLYRQISDLAFQSGLAMAVFTPPPPEEEEIFFYVPITVNAEGNFHQFGNFLPRMGPITPIVNF